jgi:hypothetical protein
MSEREVERTDRILVEDARGNRAHVDEFTTFITTTYVSGEVSRMRGMREYRMANGNHVNLRTDDGAFIELDTGVVWTRVERL